MQPDGVGAPPPGQEPDSASAVRRRFLRGAWAVVLATGAFLAWLVFRVGGDGVTTAVDDLANWWPP